jgi:hypothetical protein
MAMSLILKVPYNEKDQAKSLGAYWNPDLKSWTVPDHVNDINPFKNWIPFESGCIVRKPYLICESRTNCWKCKKEIPMIAPGAKKYFYYDDEKWLTGLSPTLFRYVFDMEDPMFTYIKTTYNFIKRRYSQTIEASYYANTCQNCGSLQGDFHHHEDFGGAFLLDPFEPKPPHVKLMTIDLPIDYHIEALPGTTAYDPIFFPNKKHPADGQGNAFNIIIF